MSNVSFKISTGLKDILGRDLITDDFIAVFELVKNSFDADARNVKISFLNLEGDNPSIIIADDGRGMDYKDIIDKWLFVAYSAKKSESDYRDKINTKRIFAGAKGIGRISCDRLGAYLELTTKKYGKEAQCWLLQVDWRLFEIDPKQEFQKIPANLLKAPDCHSLSSNSGTILKITHLRASDWDRKKLLTLRKSLEKLINPNQENDASKFSIVLDVPEQLDEDKKYLKNGKPWETINGPVKNFIFETLEVKTTQIHVEVDENGETITTRLIDRGTLVYELVESNQFSEDLHNIQITLFEMSRSAKVTFARRMGIPVIQFGSVFLYKNGFRIHPYGNANNDVWGLDSRKQQGFSRYLGSRELLGRVEIYGDNPDFQETSSRDGGLIENSAFESLKQLLFRFALARLEKYVVDLRKFGRGFDELDVPNIRDSESSTMRQKAFDIITNLTRSKDVISINYDQDILNILENNSSKSLNSFLRNLKRISASQNDPNILKEISRAEAQVLNLQRAKEEAEQETEKERERARLAEAEIRAAESLRLKAEHLAAVEKSKREEQEAEAKALTQTNTFLKAALSKDLEQLIKLHHSIMQEARIIDTNVSYLLTRHRDPNKEIKPEKLQVSLERIALASTKMKTISRFATQANFAEEAKIIEADILQYIREYITNVYRGIELDPYNQEIKIHLEGFKGMQFLMPFKPINISIILDNLISNSRKHKARNIFISVLVVKTAKCQLSVKDDGQGIKPKSIIPQLFELGTTTTDGSGLGLYHARELLAEMESSISLNESYKEGADFILTFNYKESHNEN